MNKTFFTLALLVSAIPAAALANGREISLSRSDFLSAKPIVRGGETILKLKLSKSGKSKLRRLGAKDENLEIRAESFEKSTNPEKTVL